MASFLVRMVLLMKKTRSIQNIPITEDTMKEAVLVEKMNGVNSNPITPEVKDRRHENIYFSTWDVLVLCYASERSDMI